MEFNEQELENIGAGYSANNRLENLAQMLYNKNMVDSVEREVPLTLYTPESARYELSEMGIEISIEEATTVAELLNESLRSYNNNLNRGR